jgi:anaerobic selenocysteine-containing dehydrogenase
MDSVRRVRGLWLHMTDGSMGNIWFKQPWRTSDFLKKVSWDQALDLIHGKWGKVKEYTWLI